MEQNVKRIPTEITFKSITNSIDIKPIELNTLLSFSVEEATFIFNSIISTSTLTDEEKTMCRHEIDEAKGSQKILIIFHHSDDNANKMSLFTLITQKFGDQRFNCKVSNDIETYKFNLTVRHTCSHGMDLIDEVTLDKMISYLQRRGHRYKVTFIDKTYRLDVTAGNEDEAQLISTDLELIYTVNFTANQLLNETYDILERRTHQIKMVDFINLFVTKSNIVGLTEYNSCFCFEEDDDITTNIKFDATNKRTKYYRDKFKRTQLSILFRNIKTPTLQIELFVGNIWKHIYTVSSETKEDIDFIINKIFIERDLSLKEFDDEKGIVTLNSLDDASLNMKTLFSLNEEIEKYELERGDKK